MSSARDDQDYRDMLSDIDEKGENLSRWELGFVLDLIDNDRDEMTENQRAKIEQIYEDRVD